jgi:D-alanyl-D-alanine carboxypeptidase
MIRALFAVLVTLTLVQPAGVRERAQAVVDAALAAGTAPGISAAIALPDGTVVSVVAGVSSRESKAPLAASDLMLIGSVGKTFAAARAVQLTEQGRLSLDDPIAKHLGSEPWFARLPNAKATAIRHLMTHTSGLVRYEFKQAFARDLRAAPDKAWKPEELLAYVFDEAPPFAPGEGWEYSDTNFIVLGMILEKIDGRPFYEQVNQSILTKMPGSRFVPSISREIPGLVQGYTGPNDPITGTEGPVLAGGRFVVNPQFEWTGGGFAGTPSDLVRWAKLLYEGGAFAKPASARMMIDAAVPARLGPQAKYGLGVIVRPQTPVGEVWGHSGFFPGYLTEMIYLPERRIAVAVQVNTSHQRAIGRSPLRIAYDLAGGAGL